MNILKNAFYKVKRFIVKRYLTGNLGTIAEGDKKITCYVSERKVKKAFSRSSTGFVHCSGIGKEVQEIAERYSLNKPICYVFDDMEITSKEGKIHICGDNNCKVIIKNCEFSAGAEINVSGKCIIDNTYIYFDDTVNLTADKLVMKNTNFGQKDSRICYINLSAGDTLNIINTNIGKVKVSRFLAINNINIIGSRISAEHIIFSSDDIYIDKTSSLLAGRELSVRANSFTNEAHKTKISSEKKEVVALEKSIKLLNDKKLELMRVCGKIKTGCSSFLSEFEDFLLDKVVEFEEEEKLPTSKHSKSRKRIKVRLKLKR